MNWKNFFKAAKGHDVSLIIPGVFGSDDPLRLAADAYEITEDALVFTGDDGDVRWLRLDAIIYGKIIMPSAEE